MTFLIARASIVITLSVLVGCTPLGQSKSSSRMMDGDKAAMYGVESSLRKAPYVALPANESIPVLKASQLPRWIETPPLSPGDRLSINVLDGEEFNGRYEIDIGGALMLPHLPKLMVAGSSVEDVEQLIARALVSAEWFKPLLVRVSVRVHEWTHVQVYVRGAVFSSGLVTVNSRNSEDRALKDNLMSGDFPTERLLNSALRAAGGVRPDANLAAIELVRNGQSLRIDYRGLMNGRVVPSIPLMSGDQIVVPESGVFDPQLVAPSMITPPGVRVFLSNLTVPAMNNASSAIGKHATSLPYGSRLLTAALSANCVGGAQLTNASRYTVLVRNNPVTGSEELVERSLKDLLSEPQHNTINPYLMPNDGIACYDSGVTNLREIARTITDLILPFSLF